MCILASVLEDCFGRIVEVKKCMRGEGEICPAPPRPARGKIKTNRFPKMPTFILHLKIEKNRFPKIPSFCYHLSDFLTYFFRTYLVNAKRVGGPHFSDHYAPIVRPLCAHNAPAMRPNRFGVRAMVPKCPHYAPTMRPPYV